jgi:rubrerythrin
MTVKSDIQKAIASAESAKGTYAMFAESTDDVTAKQMFQQMQQDMQRHVDMMNGRLNYLTENNTLYQQQQMMKNNQNITKTDTKITNTNKNR